MKRLSLKIRDRGPLVGAWLLGCGCGIQCGVRGIGLALAGLVLSTIPRPGEGLFSRLRGLPIAFWLFLLVSWLASGFAGQFHAVATWVETVQWTALISVAWIAVLMRRDDTRWRQALLRGVGIALILNVAVAFLQSLFPAVGAAVVSLLYGAPFTEGGVGPDLGEEYSCGLMRSQLQYCALILVSLTVVGPSLVRFGQRSRRALICAAWLSGGLLVGIGCTVRPVYVILAVVVLAVRCCMVGFRRDGVVGRVERQWTAWAVVLCLLAGFCVAGLGRRAPSSWEYVAPFVRVPSGGAEAKRSVVEWGGAIQAISDHPFGYGPGTYAQSVRHASALAGLPKPSQNRVRRDGNSQIQIFLIEVGILGTLFFLIGLGCGLSSWVGGAEVGGDVAGALHGRSCVGVVLFAAAFTGIFSTGLGPLCCVLLLSPLSRPVVPGKTRRGFAMLVLQVISLLLAGGVGHLIASHSGGGRDTMSGSDSGQRPDVMVAVEVEEATYLAGGFVRRSAHDCGRNAVLSLPVGAGKKSGRCSLRVTVPEAGLYRLWLRVYWEGGCSNSIQARVDDGALLTFEDAIFNRWHWVDATPSEPLELEEGEHRVELVSTEDGIQVDQLVLTGDVRRVPIGVISHSPAETEIESGPSEGSGTEVLDFDAGGMPRDDEFDKYKENE